MAHAEVAISPAAGVRRTKVLSYERILAGLGLLAAVALIAQAGVALWATQEFTQAESIIAIQSRALVEEGKLYHSLQDYPFTVCAYMPIFYFLRGGLAAAGLPELAAGRLISLAALGAILWLTYSILRIYGRERLTAVTGLVLAGTTHLLTGWGAVGQTDMLAIAFSLGAIYLYSRSRQAGESRVLGAALLALAGLMTKQTVLAAPAAIFLLLLRDDRKKAALFAAVLAFGGVALVAAMEIWTGGNFLRNTLHANLNPFAGYKVMQHLETGAALAGLVVMAAAGIRLAVERHYAPVYLYLGLASALLAATCGKVGSDTNYQIETAIALCLAAALGLEAVGFYEAFSRGAQTPVTLLVLAIALHAALNLRMAAHQVTDRTRRAAELAAQVDAIAPMLPQSGRVVSADTNLLLRTRRPLLVEPLIYTLLVEAGRIDGGLLLADLRAGTISTVVLYEDLARPSVSDAELPRLPAAHTAVVRDTYRLVRHVPGPYKNGLFLYQPAGSIR